MTALALAVCLVLPAPVQVPEPSLEARVLAVVPDGYELHQSYRLPSGQEARRGYAPAFSPDGAQVAYLAWKQGEAHPALGVDVEQDGFDLAYAPVWSADGSTVAFVVGRSKRGGKQEWRVIANGDTVDKGDWFGLVRVSDDGERLAWWSQPGAEIDSDGFYAQVPSVLVVAERKGKRWSAKEGEEWPMGKTDVRPAFAGDRALASAYDGSGWTVFQSDGKREQPLTEPSAYLVDWAAAPDGDLAVVIWDWDREVDPVNGEEVRPYSLYVDGRQLDVEADSVGLPTFTPDGKGLAFGYLEDGRLGVGVGRKLLPPSEHPITRVLPSPDGKRVAWVEHEGGKLQTMWYLSPLGEDYVFEAQAHVAVRDVEGSDEPVRSAAFDHLGEVAFSPDSQRVAFAGQAGREWFVVCGERRRGPYDEVGALRFSGDGRHLAFGARVGRELRWEVVELEAGGRSR